METAFAILPHIGFFFNPEFVLQRYKKVYNIRVN